MLRYVGVFLLFGGLAHAQVFNGPISSAMGGTGRAGMESSEAAFLNPALLPVLKGYQSSAFYRDGQLEPNLHMQMLGIGAADNTSGVLFPGSLHYLRLRETGLAAHPVNAQVWHVAAGWMPQEQFSFGVSAYNLNDKIEQGKTYSQWNGSLGALWVISPQFGVAYVLDNLLSPPASTPIALRQTLRQSLGFYGAFQGMLRARVDLSRDEQNNPHKRWIYRAGLESSTSPFFVVRLGYRLDDEHDQRVWTAGLGFNGPRLKIDYSFQKNVSYASGALHSVDMRLAF